MLEYKRIKIASKKNETIELVSFLNDIIEFDSKFKLYNFGIVRFYGTTKDYSNENLSENINIFSDWNSFLNLIVNIDQVFEIEVLIDKTIQNIRRYSNEEDSYRNNQICLEFFDDGFWEITCKNDDLIRLMAEKYSESEFR
ncbi:hypothetical protein ACQWU4_07045 [Chryseobacterium sp. MIQD13]|uniref:hypothetical protein n=1 Tax=Chryseobacterium sp. MIQD13 TaxID=3422310 RepID=UPI003D26F21D